MKHVRGFDGLRRIESSVMLAILGGDLQRWRAFRGVEEGRSVECSTSRRSGVQPAMRAAARLPHAALERALAHAARIDRATKGVGPGEPWDEFVRLGLELLRGTEVARKVG
jgi:hypothetical protein